MRRVVVVVVVVARDVVAVPHARCPRVHRAWTRAEVASAIAVRVAVCRVESNRIESDKPLAGVFVGGAGETRDAGREGTDATKEAEDERPIGSSMTNVTPRGALTCYAARSLASARGANESLFSKSGYSNTTISRGEARAF